MEQVRKDMPRSPYVAAGIKHVVWHPRNTLYAPNIVKNAITLVTKIKWRDIVAANRGKQAVAEARQAAYYYLYTFSRMTVKEIGEYMHRDHSTVTTGKQAFYDAVITGQALDLATRVSITIDNIQSSKNHSPHDYNH